MIYDLIGQLASNSDFTKYEIISYFRESGIIHLLAISGIHFAIITFIIFLLVTKILSLFPKLFVQYNIPSIACLITIAGNAIFLELTKYPTSASRAFIMSGYYLTGKALNLPTTSIRIFLLALITLYYFEDEIIPSISFQLSFTATLALIVFFSDRKDNHSNKILIFIKNNFYVSLVCYFATLPIIIYHFQHLPLYSIGANMVVVPIFSFIFLPLFFLGKIIATQFPHNLLLDFSNYIFFQFIDIAKYVSELPYAYLHIRTNQLSLISFCALFWCKIIFKKAPIINSFFLIIFAFSIIFNQESNHDITIPKKGNYIIINEEEKRYYVINDGTEPLENLYQTEHYKHSTKPVICNKDVCKIINNNYFITAIFNKIPEEEYLELCRNSELIIDYAYINIPCKHTRTITKRDIWFNGNYYLKLGNKLEIYNDLIS